MDHRNRRIRRRRRQHARPTLQFLAIRRPTRLQANARETNSRVLHRQGRHRSNVQTTFPHYNHPQRHHRRRMNTVHIVSEASHRTLQVDSTIGNYLDALFYHLKIDLRQPSTYMQVFYYEEVIEHRAKAIDLATKRQVIIYRRGHSGEPPKFDFNIIEGIDPVVTTSNTRWLPTDKIRPWDIPITNT